MNKTTAFVYDLIAIIVFAVLARMAHQSDEMPFTLGGILSTLWPFALGVVLGWLVLRANRGVWIWLITVVTGLVIWGIRNGAVPHWSFIIVATVMSALLMLGWRGVYKLASRRSAHASS